MALYIGRSKRYGYELGEESNYWNGDEGFAGYEVHYIEPDESWVSKLGLEPGEIRKIKNITIELEEEE